MPKNIVTLCLTYFINVHQNL
uniref:Uncharacterized protein n=1 Tax=Rhizophora mucronata TaxID=61149 RepID=A0A2P2P0P3_RHIMU